MEEGEELELNDIRCWRGETTQVIPPFPDSRVGAVEALKLLEGMLLREVFVAESKESFELCRAKFLPSDLRVFSQRKSQTRSTFRESYVPLW